MTDPSPRVKDLRRIEAALREAEKALAPYTPGAIAVERKAGGDPVTEADHRVDEVLRNLLPEEGEGWLSEETVDDHVRLGKRRAWVVIAAQTSKSVSLLRVQRHAPGGPRHGHDHRPPGLDRGRELLRGDRGRRD